MVAAEFAAKRLDFDGLLDVARFARGFFVFEGSELPLQAGVGARDEAGVAVVESRVRSRGEPLDAVDPRRAGGEPRPPDDAATPDHAAGLVLIGLGEDILVRVEP